MRPGEKNRGKVKNRGKKSGEKSGESHQNKVHVTAYSPLGSSPETFKDTKPNPLNLLQDKRVVEISKKYKKSVAQILLKFQRIRGVLVIPKSANVDRMKSNFELLNWEFEKDDLEELKSMNSNLRGWTEERVMHSKYFPW